MNIDTLNWVFEMDCLGTEISLDQASSLLASCPDRSLAEAKFLEGIVAEAGSVSLRKIA